MHEVVLQINDGQKLCVITLLTKADVKNQSLHLMRFVPHRHPTITARYRVFALFLRKIESNLSKLQITLSSYKTTTYYLHILVHYT